MDKHIIPSLALLKVYHDEFGKGYIDNYIPFMVECLRLLSYEDEYVSSIKLGELALKQFGIKLPAQVINKLLNKLARLGYVVVEFKAYKIVPSKLETFNLSEHSNAIEIQYEKLIKSIMQYAQKLNVNWSLEDTEIALLNFFSDVQLSVIDIRSPDSDLELGKKGASYVIGSYISNASVKNLENFTFLETIYKGAILSNAIFVPSLNDSPQMKFENTEIYFDTTFLLYALGHTGVELQASAKELIALLLYSKAKLCCFSHTLEEMQGILEGNARILQRDPAELYGPSATYILQKKYKPSDLKMFAANLARDLQVLGIIVKDRPEYKHHQYVIDEQKLANDLKEALPKQHERRIEKDVSSISAIRRIRANRTSPFLEKCGAIFVTTNRAITIVVRKFWIPDEDSTSVPLCITDSDLTNFLWLKNPNQAPDLPRKKLIANAYASIQPTDRLWRKFIDEVNKLKGNGSIDESTYYNLRYSLSTRNDLMQYTLGEEELLTQASIQDILKHVIDEKEKLKDEEIFLLRTEQNNNQETQRNVLQNMKRSATIFSTVVSSIFCILLSAFIIGLYYVSDIQCKNQNIEPIYQQWCFYFNILYQFIGISTIIFGGSILAIAGLLYKTTYNLSLNYLNQFKVLKE